MAQLAQLTYTESRGAQEKRDPLGTAWAPDPHGPLHLMLQWAQSECLRGLRSKGLSAEALQLSHHGVEALSDDRLPGVAARWYVVILEHALVRLCAR